MFCFVATYLCITWNVNVILELRKNQIVNIINILGCIKNLNGPVLFPIGKEEEVVNFHPRAVFIPQNGCSFLAAGIFSLYSVIISLFILPWLFQAASSMLPVLEL